MPRRNTIRLASKISQSLLQFTHDYGKLNLKFNLKNISCHVPKNKQKKHRGLTLLKLDKFTYFERFTAKLVVGLAAKCQPNKPKKTS